MRALALVIVLFGCDSTRPCAKGSVFLTLRFDAATAGADSVDVTISLDGGAEKSMSYPRRSGSSSSLQIDFPSSYPAGGSLSVSVNAKLGADTLGSGAMTYTLAAGCSTVELTISGLEHDLAGSDLLPGDLASTDLALKQVGDPCTLGDNCTCVDGYCCASACTDPCAACNVAGKEGTCSAVSGTPHGARGCTGAGTVCAGSCDGTNTAACVYGTAACSPATCTAGVAYAPGECSMGMCNPVGTPCSDGLCGATACVSVSQVVSAAQFSCVLLSDATVRCWGTNDSGSFGVPTATLASSYTPIPVPGLSGVSMIAAGGHHMCAIISGAVRCWGDNTDGELGIGTVGGSVPSPGPVCATGMGGSCVPFTGATAVYAGATNSCAIANSGRVYCWGNNFKGQVGVTPGSPVPNPFQVCSPAGCATHLGDSNPIQQLALGYTHTLALDNVGTVYCWGNNADGACGLDCNSVLTTTSSPVVVPNLTVGAQKPIQVATSELTGFAVISDGTTANNLVRSWGKGTYGEHGNDTSTTVCASPAPVASVCKSAACGSLLTGASSVGTAYDGICAIVGGAVWCWGTDYWGELGNGTVMAGYTLYAVPSLLTSGALELTQQGFTSNHFCARVQNGTLRCWGGNQYGELAQGVASGTPSPSPVVPHW